MQAAKSRWIKVADAGGLSVGAAKVVNVPNEGVALFNVDGDLCAIGNACPHQGGPLGEGPLSGDVVTCPWHGWQYNVRTGRPVVTPAVKTFDVRRAGTSIEINVPELEPAHDAPALEDGDALRARTKIPEILDHVQRARTLDEVVESVYVGLQAVLPHNRLGIALLDESGAKLVQVKTRSDRRILLNDGFSAPVAGSSLQRILELGEPRVIDDLRDQYAQRPNGWTKLILDEGMRSSLTLPLKVGGRAIGVVFFTSATPGAFSEAHVGVLKQIATQLSVLIEKGRWVSELAQSHERYRTLLDVSNEGIFLCASTSKPFMTVNDNLCRWLGYEYEELVQMSLADLIAASRLEEISTSPDDRRRWPATVETELMKKDHTTLPVELRIAPATDRGRPLLQGFVRDLTEIQQLTAELHRQHSFQGLIGKSLALQDICDLIRQVAPLSTTVLVQGESGTGKELVARAIHHSSARAKKPFVAVNCGALVETLLESELFGHVRGAFSGATQTRQGRFELAEGGTIFLDEVAELSPATQVKLLRVLQEGEFEKVGSSATQRVDLRIIAATNRDLIAAMRDGRFREDLYYRLHVVPIVIPPLRERREDIALLVDHFVRKFNRLMGRSIEGISREVAAILIEHPFRGNVRELENVVEYAFVKCQGRRIERRHLPPHVGGSRDDLVSVALSAKAPLKALQRELIRRMVRDCDGNVQAAAKRLGISRTTLWRKIRRSADTAGS